MMIESALKIAVKLIFVISTIITFFFVAAMYFCYKKRK